MALTCSLRAVYTMRLVYKATSTNYMICCDFNCHITKREKPKICLTNHKGSISHSIMPLAINSLRGGHTHAHMNAYRHRRQKQFQETRRMPDEGQHMLGLKRKSCFSFIIVIILIKGVPIPLLSNTYFQYQVQVQIAK